MLRWRALLAAASRRCIAFSRESLQASFVVFASRFFRAERAGCDAGTTLRLLLRRVWGARKHAAQEFAFDLKLFANSIDLVLADFAGPMECHFELLPLLQSTAKPTLGSV
jgi:hypothetical protein